MNFVSGSINGNEKVMFGKGVAKRRTTRFSVYSGAIRHDVDYLLAIFRAAVLMGGGGRIRFRG